MKPVSRSGKFITTGTPSFFFNFPAATAEMACCENSRSNFVSRAAAATMRSRKKRIREIFEIAQFRVTAHRPLREWVQSDAEFFLHVFRIVNLRAKDVDFVAAPDHFLDEIDGLRRTAAGRRIKRFVREKRDAERRWHAQTLGILPRRFNPFYRRKCFDLRRKKSKLPLRFVDGVIAQLVERLNGIQKVRSSSLLGSTILGKSHLQSNLPCLLVIALAP